MHSEQTASPSMNNLVPGGGIRTRCVSRGRRGSLCLLLIAAVGLGSSGVRASDPLSDALRRFKKDNDAQETKTIAYFEIPSTLVETPTHMPPLFGNEPPISLKGLLERLKKARTDDDVVAVVIDLNEASMGLGQLQELHQALRAFSAVDKPVFVHADALRTLTYVAATGASHISVVPTGDVWLVGLYGESLYLRGMLDKIGCVPDFERCGDYKSATEVFMREGPSEEAKKMMDWLMDGLYEEIVRMIADGRGIPPQRVRRLIDAGPYHAQAALEAGLIDSVRSRRAFIDDIKKRYGKDVKVVTDYGKKDEMEIPQDPFAMFSWLMQLLHPSPKTYTEPSVAVVYVEGPIQLGSEEVSPFGGTAGAFSSTLRKALDKAAKDDSVKAVVLRIDSPGGSALASEIILNASRRVAERKPLVVSMGNVAASGGYYVTCAARTIFADPGTITGSIGVLGGKIVTTGMWDKLGVHWYPHKRGEMAALLSTATPFSDTERRKIRDYIETIYETFKKHVTEARGDRLAKPIDEIAGGRVYTGRQALELGLVDKIGGLEDAIQYAAETAGLGKFEIRVIPEPKSLFDLFMPKKKDDEFARGSAASPWTSSPWFRSTLSTLAAVEPMRARALYHTLRGLEVLRTERAVMMMPEILIR